MSVDKDRRPSPEIMPDYNFSEDAKEVLRRTQQRRFNGIPANGDGTEFLLQSLLEDDSAREILVEANINPDGINKKIIAKNYDREPVGIARQFFAPKVIEIVDRAHTLAGINPITSSDLLLAIPGHHGVAAAVLFQITGKMDPEIKADLVSARNQIRGAQVVRQLESDLRPSPLSAAS